MHGSALVTTEELVCVAADPSDPILDVIRTAAADRDLDCRVVPVGESLGDPGLPYRTLGVAVGGDGVFLEAVRAFAPRGIPVTGVSRGRLSFLPRIPPDDVGPALAEILDGRAAVVDRQQFRVDGPGLNATGINDVSLEPPKIATVGTPDSPPPRTKPRPACTVHAYARGEYIGRYSGDGVVVATPIGSTAWALSAGGPVQRPAASHTMQLIDLHHEALGVRPLVMDADTEIRLVPETVARVWVDGGRTVDTVAPGGTVLVTGADQPARVVRTSYETPFLATLARKLGWALRDDGPAPFRGPTRGLDVAGGLDLSWPPAVADGDQLPPAAVTGERRDDRWDTDERPADWPGARPPDRDQSPADPRIRAWWTACEAAKAAGEYLHWQFRRPPGAEPHAAPTTDELTGASERILSTVIATAFPDDAIVSEGRQLQPGETGTRWVLDPLDGESNYRHGNPNYCTTIALLEDGVPVVGVVFVPESDELFHAVTDRGAFRNASAIEPTDRDALDESMVLSGYDPDGQFLDRVYRRSRGVRKLGSQALDLCFVAAGSADGLWEHDTEPWDVAAGLCILRAAGGTVTDADGNPYVLADATDERTPLLASNGPLHDALLANVVEIE